jgi:hypothetical protein
MEFSSVSCTTDGFPRRVLFHGVICPPYFVSSYGRQQFPEDIVSAVHSHPINDIPFFLFIFGQIIKSVPGRMSVYNEKAAKLANPL